MSRSTRSIYCETKDFQSNAIKVDVERKKNALVASCKKILIVATMDNTIITTTNAPNTYLTY